jgi:hypothetical protein
METFMITLLRCDIWRSQSYLLVPGSNIIAWSKEYDTDIRKATQ